MKQVGWAVVLLLIGGVVGYFIKQPDTVEIQIPGPVVFKPKIEYRDTGIVVRIPPGPIDSAAVVEAYYTHRPFTFTDTVQEVALRFDGVLFRNELITSSLTLHNFRRPEILEPWTIWGDVQAGQMSFSLGASVEKGKNRFGVNYDIIQQSVNFRYSRRLFEF